MNNDVRSTAVISEEASATTVEPPNSLAVLASRPDVDPCDVCCEAMPGFICGDLPTIDTQWMATHTEHCTYCRNELKGFQRLDHLLAEYETAYCKTMEAPPMRHEIRTIARYGTMDQSPLGSLLIATTDAGVCEIDFGRGMTIDQFAKLLTQRGYDPVFDQQAIQPVVSELTDYFQGHRKTFDLPIDYSRLTPFARAVLQATAAIPTGGVATYSDIAKQIGKPGASRAVGNALGHNPVPIILPCHRVVPANRSIGNYTGGVDIKVTLLSLEGALLPTGALVS